MSFENLELNEINFNLLYQKVRYIDKKVTWFNITQLSAILGLILSIWFK